jgi:hypothetical protein
MAYQEYQDDETAPELHGAREHFAYIEESLDPGAILKIDPNPEEAEAIVAALVGVFGEIPIDASWMRRYLEALKTGERS